MSDIFCQVYSPLCSYRTVHLIPIKGWQTIALKTTDDSSCVVSKSLSSIIGFSCKYNSIQCFTSSSRSLSVFSWHHFIKLFQLVVADRQHTLHSLLPPESIIAYNLRPRAHNLTLPDKHCALDGCNFVTRTLHANCY